jgi:hypothetical protein
MYVIFILSWVLCFIQHMLMCGFFWKLHYCCEPCAYFWSTLVIIFNFMCIYSTIGGHLTNLWIHGMQYVCMYICYFQNVSYCSDAFISHLQGTGKFMVLNCYSPPPQTISPIDDNCIVCLKAEQSVIFSMALFRKFRLWEPFKGTFHMLRSRYQGNVLTNCYRSNDTYAR